jgi:sulfoxide reductase catalytic subunit YedY
MLIRKRRAGEGDIPSSEITPEKIYLDRRSFLAEGAALAAAAVLVPGVPRAVRSGLGRMRDLAVGLDATDDDKPNTYDEITHYNNFYEFGADKEDPYKNSGAFKPLPWSVRIEGECNKPGTYALEDFLKGLEVIEPTYRHRCVEAWSMVIPWRGVRMRDALLRAEPTGKAKFVEMTTVMRPSEMPGQRYPLLDWPYVEGLRLDEALNQLTLLATGIYGKDLLNQNGAPLRLVTPWKYGFKSIKSIVKIRFVENMPKNTWQIMAKDEYGFYANVNPNVDHPRWSQARERRIGELSRRPTLMFNGYGEQVASMYQGLDLRKWY